MTAALLDAWERAQAQPPAARALALLAVACPGQPPECLARLPLGRRDAHLLDLRERLFGAHVVSLSDCPACGEPVELAFETGDVRVDPPESDPEAPVTVEAAGCQAAFRLPDSLDMTALSPDEDQDAAARRLLARCLLRAERDGVPVPAEALPEGLMLAASARLAEADPQADVQIALSCPACGVGWGAAFEIDAFLWAEVDIWAQRLLRDVHRLASAYGWREADILALSPARRGFYLEMVAE